VSFATTASVLFLDRCLLLCLLHEICDFLLAILKEQSIYIKFGFKLEYTALSMHEMLKTAFGNYVMGTAQTSEWFLLIQT